MSEYGDDRKVLEKGRKPLKDVEAQLVDQIPIKLLKQLRKEDWGIKVTQLWNKANGEQSLRLERQRTYLKDWDEFLDRNDLGSFEGSSQLHLPMTFTVCKTYHSRTVATLLGMDPAFQVKSRKGIGAEREEEIQQLLRYTINEWANKNKGAHTVLHSWLWQWITTGTGVLKMRWDTEYTKYVDVQPELKQLPPIIQYDEEGNAIEIPQIIAEDKEIEVVKKCFDGPIFECLLPEDFLMVGGNGDVQEADAVFQRQYMTSSELWTLADRKIFDKAAVEKIIEGGPNKKHSSYSLQGTRDQSAGVMTFDSNSEHDRYEIVELHTRIDVDGSGIFSDIVLFANPQSGELLRATYLRRVSKDGKRPFGVIHFHKKEGSTYGMGLPEVMHPLSVELDAIHNMRIDFGTLATMPFGFYRASSSLNPKTLELRPGVLIPTDNPQTDVFFPNLGNRTTFGMQEEAGIMTYVERLTGLSDLSYGMMSGTQGAARTATGARAIQNESSANLDLHIKRMNLGWESVLRILFHMLQQRIEPGFSYRVTGQNGQDYWDTINMDTLMHDFDFVVTANSSNSNPQIRMDNAERLMQFALNPVLIQMGIMQPSNMFEVTKNYLKAYDITDAYRFITKPAEYTLTLTPEEEVQRILNGLQAPVYPNSDHQGFIAYAQDIMKNDTEFGKLAPGQAQALARQMQEHAKMAEALQQAAAQQANQGQMQANQRAGAAIPGM